MDPTSAEAGPLMEVKSSSQLTSMGSVEVESCRWAFQQFLILTPAPSISSILSAIFVVGLHIKIRPIRECRGFAACLVHLVNQNNMMQACFKS